MTVATLEIARGTPDSRLEHQRFEVPFEDGDSVLDGLMWIRAHRDASLSFWYSCINANVCKECLMLVDGKVGYACTARLKTGLTTLDPLPNKPWIRDLACQTTPPKERL